MGITYGDHLIDSGYYDITPEQEREIEERRGIDFECEDCIGKWFNSFPRGEMRCIKLDVARMTERRVQCETIGRRSGWIVCARDDQAGGFDGANLVPQIRIAQDATAGCIALRVSLPNH